jgi:hypothetical protein
MYAKVREAAKAAAADINPALPAKERIATIVDTYKPVWKEVSHNIRAIFVDAITLLALPADPVEFTSGKGDARITEKVTALSAVDKSKNMLRDAAKQVRDNHGLGRQAGGGRVAAGVAPAAPEATFTDQLLVKMQDAAERARIFAALATIGYEVKIKNRKLVPADVPATSLGAELAKAA